MAAHQRSDCPCTGPSGPETRPSSRREFLARAGGGFGALALASILAGDGLLAAAATPGTHHAAPAKRAIFIFLSGGASHLETFDPKPELGRLHGQRLPDSFGRVATRRGVEKNKLLASRRTFRRFGQSGLEVSDLLPHLAEHADDICLLRGCYGDSVTHPESVYLMNTGSIFMGRPSLGAWLSYGLGTENHDLPAYVVLPDPAGWVKGGAPAWGNGYLPARYQGTLFAGGAEPVRYLARPAGVSAEQDRRTLDFAQELNRGHLARSGAAGTPAGDELSARIAAYELAFRMQAQAPAVVDVAGETETTRRLYGLDRKETAEFGARCLLARRLVERGVRFVQVYSGDTNGWDAHNDIEENHRRLCAESDQPVAALLKDLKARGLLESTLVIWGGEFGRTPMSEGTTGRDHNPHGFCMWLSGGGVKPGQVIGSTDAVGLRAESERTHVHDLHATILHLMGLDHLRLTYRHNGRDERLTDVAGVVVRKALA